MSPAGGAAAPDEQERPAWDFSEGDEIVPGRSALRSLGGGYDYEAYLVWDDELFSLAVAKCLRPHLVGKERALNALRREAELLARLNHPVVVRGFGAVLDGDRPHILMEHLEGPTLSSLVKRFGPIPLEQLLPLTMQICSSLHYLHSQKIVHLDVKPRNVIMGAPPRLIDLSVARSFDDAARISAWIGTDAYMAPEQCRPAEATIGPGADIWGLGASLYRAVAGRVPFPRPDYDAEQHRDRPEVRFPQLSRTFEPLPKGVPEPVREVIAACLDPDAARRPSVAEIVGQIEPLVAGLPTRPVLRKRRPGTRR